MLVRGLFFKCVCVSVPGPAVSSSRYEIPSGGAIDVISPANSPAQSQQQQQQDDRDRADRERADRDRADRDRAAQAAVQGEMALYTVKNT